MALMTVEATAIAKGMELKHGNSDHYVTFELESGERVYFHVSMKIYMLVIEGDHCLITYKDSQYGKKKLKSFERIGKATPVSTVASSTTSAPVAAVKTGSPTLSSRSVEPKKSFEPVKSLKESATLKEGNARFVEEESAEFSASSEKSSGYKPHKLLQKLDATINKASADKENS